MAKKQEVRIPDIGDFDEVSVVEVLVAVGDQVDVDDPLITLESDKASMEVPATHAGIVQSLAVKVGDNVGEDAVIAVLEVTDDDAKDEGEDGGGVDGAGQAEESKPEAKDDAENRKPEKAESPKAPAKKPAPTPPGRPDAPIDEKSFAQAYAGPAVRRYARELGVDLGRVKGTGRKGRILREDVQGYVKQALAGGSGAAASSVDGFAWPAMPEIDFSQFGPVETVPLSRIRRIAARNLHRSWLHVPHVTQHEDADITELEAFRKAQSAAAKAKGFKLTPVAFQLKASAAALQAFPDFNASLHPDGEQLIRKGYIHIGVAVDTPDGLVVPVIRDVDKKGLYQLAQELVEASERARTKKLRPADLQGAGFTISSLGGIGGTSFTPIVNAPEVAILGVSRAVMKPVFQDGAFVPRLMLPLSLSYDHRVIDGAQGARFIVHLSRLLGDLRQLLL